LIVTNPFPTPFANEIGHECYSFTDGFWGYNQVPIVEEDDEKKTFVSDFSSFAYTIMPFGLKNAPTVFSKTVVKAFQEYIYKTMVVDFDDWNFYSILKYHIQ